jgi:hypothetical protein
VSQPTCHGGLVVAAGDGLVMTISGQSIFIVIPELSNIYGAVCLTPRTETDGNNSVRRLCQQVSSFYQLQGNCTDSSEIFFNCGAGGLNMFDVLLEQHADGEMEPRSIRRE